MVYSVKAKWEACMVSRKSKVSIFTKCLYGKRDHTRACLEQRLKERARCHLIQFDKFFYSAFGTNPHDLIKTLRTHYSLASWKRSKRSSTNTTTSTVTGTQESLSTTLYPQNQHPLQGSMHETLPQLETLCPITPLMCLPLLILNNRSLSGYLKNMQ